MTKQTEDRLRLERDIANLRLQAIEEDRDREEREIKRLKELAELHARIEALGENCGS